MPLREIAGTDFRYFLIAFDENGVERAETDGSRMSETIRQRVEEDDVTDVFFTSHGWKGDIPAAIEQYDRWVAAMASLDADRAAMRARRPDFEPLVVGLHWPSLPWGDESFEESTPGVLGVARDIDREVEAYAKRIADTPLARQAIRRILVAAGTSSQLTSQMQKDYATLFVEAKLGGDIADVEHEGFDPAAIIEEYKATEPASQEQAQVLGWTEVKDAVLSPLRQLSFWKMKDRARRFGETGAHELLVALQTAAPVARFHLMGHSFGCIVVSATVAGGDNSTPLPRPVDSLFLVQGALSLWSYADDIPYARNTPGYFNRIVKQRLVRGPIVTTRSKFDTAVGRFYPMGAKLKSQLTLRGEKFPKYGGVGSFGLQGIAAVEDGVMGDAGFVYGFRNGAIYNLESSGVIKEGEGASGAHSDIAHAEVAHAFWAAVMAKEGATMRGGGFLGGTLRAEPQAPPPAMSEATPESIQQPSPAARYINAAVEDHAKEAPLKTGEWYVVAFDVDTTPREQSVSAVRFEEQQLFEREEEIVELTVQLASSDFDIQEPTRRLRVPRAGKSQGKARFDVSPRHDGRASLTATFHKQGNFVQQIDVAFNVGAAMGAVPQTMSRGRSPAAANVLFPREVGLSIEPGVGGYDCIVWGPVAAKAKLPLQAAELAAAIDVAREELMKVVYQNSGGKLVFQQGIDVPEPDREVALKVMARAGRQLFQKLFFGPAAGADSRKVGEYLQTMARDATARLHVQIVANAVPVPWGLLYLGEVAGGAQLDWDNFLGMRHVIEVIPLQTELRVTQSTIPSDKPMLAVSLNLNESIDAQMGAKFVADQRTFWDKAAQSRHRMRVTGRSKSTELAKALGTAGTEDQILYFYCHAASTGLADPGGPDASSLVLTDAPITLGDLNLDAPTSVQLSGNPLVFINACESGKMSPTFYDGFVPYFMAKGARGVVGTECETPAMFAAAWAQRFFERFLDGEPLGEAFLNLRREFLLEHNNPLGLMYAVHCDGDTQIQPALKA
jgi:CHAT domain